MPGLNLDNLPIKDESDISDPATGIGPAGSLDLGNLPLTQSDILGESYQRAARRKPEENIKIKGLADSTGLPPVTVANNTQDVEKKASAPDWESLSDNLKTQLTKDQELMDAAYDDLPNLSWWDNINVGFERGQLTTQEGHAGTAMRARDETTIPDNVKQIRERLKQLGEPTGSGFGSFLEAASMVIGQQVESFSSQKAVNRIGTGVLTGIAAGATGGPLAPVTSTIGGLAGLGAGVLSHAFADSFEVEGGLMYLEMIDTGIDPNVAKWLSVGGGLTNAILEVGSDTVLLAPISKLGKKFIKDGVKEALKNKTVIAAAKEFALTYGAGIGAEVSTEVMQEVTNIVAVEIGKQFSDGDFEELTQDEVQSRLATIAIQTFKAMALLAAPGPGANFVYDVSQSKNAKTSQQKIIDIVQNATDSALRERSPGKFAKYVNTSLEGSENENIRISADGIVELFQNNPDAVDTFRQAVPDLDAQIAEATLNDGDIVIPMGDYAAYIAPSEYQAGIKKHIRLQEGDATLAEAESFDTDQRDRLIRDYEEYAAQIAPQQEAATAGSAVYDDVKKQLDVAGQTPEAADANAAVHRAFFETMAENTNQDAWQLYSGQKLRIQSEKTRTRDQLDEYIGKAISGKISTEVDEKGKPTKAAKAEQKGVADVAAEIDRLGLEDGSLAKAIRKDVLDQYAKYTKETQKDIKEYASNGHKLSNQPSIFDIPEPKLLSFEEWVNEDYPDNPKIQFKQYDSPFLNSEAVENIADAYVELRRPNDFLYDNLPDRYKHIDSANEDGWSASLIDDISYVFSQSYLEEIAKDLGLESYFLTVEKSSETTGRKKPYEINIRTGKITEFKGEPDKGAYVVIPKIMIAEKFKSNPGRFLLKVKELTGIIDDSNKAAVEDFLGMAREFSKSNREKEYKKSPNGRRASFNVVQGGKGAVADVAAEIDRLGLDVKNMTPEQIREALLAGDGQKYDQRGADTRAKLLQEGDKPRGSIQFKDTETLISLYKNANMSTFLHESGHMFLNVFIPLAQRTDAPAQMKQDLAAILDFLEVDSLEQLNPKTGGDKAITAQEKWARGFEAYLREGKAPSQALRSAFRKFKSWLLNVYRTLRGLNVEVNNEIREVMDRMLATEDQIQATQQRNRYKTVFKTAEEMGVSEEKFAEINKANNDATEKAKENLLLKMIKQITREKKQWWRDEKKKVRGEVEAEFSKRKDFKVKYFLQFGTMPDGTEAAIEPVKLSRADLIAMYGEKGIWKKLPFGKNAVWIKDGGVHPNFIAEQFGFSSGDQMVSAIIDAGNMKAAIAEETQNRMLQKYGDILNDGTIEQEAEDAVHNVDRATAMMAEVNALSKRTGIKVSPKQVIKAAAEQIIMRKKVKDATPGRYLQAERRATDKLLKAIEAGDDVTAIKHANQRILNHYLYMSARDANKKVNAIQRRMRKFDKKSTQQKIGKAGFDYLEQILGLLDLVEFRRSISAAKVIRAQSYAEWVKEQEDADAPVIENERLMNMAGRTHWRELTVSELIDFNDTILNIEHLAATKNRLIVGKERRDLNDVADAVVKSITESLDPKKTTFNTRRKKNQRARTISQFLGIAIKAQSRIEVMDGGKKIGVVYSALKRLIDKGEIDRYTRIQAESDKFFNIVSSFYGNGKKIGEKEIFNTFEKLSSSKTEVFIEEINESLTKEERIMVALNLGTKKNKQRFLDGRGFTGLQARAIIDTLDENDWKFVRAIWDFNESFWGEIAELEKRRTGITPQKQERIKVSTKFGDVEGGYIPIKFDAEQDIDAQEIGNEQTFKEMRSGRNSRAQTRRGHTKERVAGDVKIVVRVDFGVLQEHMNEVITDLTMGEAIDASYRVLHHKDVKTAIQNTMGADIFQELDIWLEDVAVGSVQAAGGFSRTLKGLRASVTVGAMGFKVATSLIQVSGFTQSWVEVGNKYMLKGLTKYISSIRNRKLIDSVFEKSAFMRERATTFQRDIRDALQRLEGDGLINNFQKSLFWPIVKMQQMVDIPTWMGAYEKGIVEGTARGLTEESLDLFAINYADQAVENSQGTGMFKGLSAIERGTLNKQTRTTEIVKLWTTFYSYFNTKLNLAYRQTKNTDFKSPGQVAKLAADYLMLFWFEAVIGEILLGRTPDFEDDDDPELAMLWYHIKLTLATIAGTLPILRELSSVMQGYGAAPGGTRGIETLGRGVKAVGDTVESLATDKDVDGYKVAQNLVSAVNVVSPVKYPSGQINVAIEAMRRKSEGDDVTVMDYLIREQKK